jgi:hypothetical protein
MLTDLFHVQDKIDRVDRFTMQLAVAREAVHCIRLGVHLHARRLIVMEGAAQSPALVGFQAIVLQHLADL